MPAVNPYEEYKKQAIMTATPGELVVKLGRGCSSRLNQAVMYMEENNTEKAEEALYTAQRIVNYLNASLDRKIPISNELHALYDYFVRRIVKAKIRMDPEIVKEIIPMIDGLGDSFQEAEKIIHKK